MVMQWAQRRGRVHSPRLTLQHLRQLLPRLPSTRLMLLQAQAQWSLARSQTSLLLLQQLQLHA
jgi:hypothetical protein